MATGTPPGTTSSIFYPESDGKPMAETDVHRDVMIATITTLIDFFRDRPDVYVAGNLLLYYEEGNPRASVAPDSFVVFGVGKGQRRTYKLWEEGQPPAVVVEVTSRATRREDLRTKPKLYQSLGVREYFLFDPLEEYLRPSLQGFRLANNAYVALQPDEDGAVLSEALDMRLRREGVHLRLIDLRTGDALLRPEEVAEARRSEAAARKAVEERLTTVEAELAQLRAELARLQGLKGHEPE
jgi:Uma2 family endonuclease